MTSNVLETTMWEFPLLDDVDEYLIESYNVANDTQNNPSPNSAQNNDVAKPNLLSESELRELNKLKIDYEAKISIVDKLLAKLSDLTNNLDNEVIQLLENIIKTSVKKIILKEISLDNQIISKMIEDLKGMLDHEQEYIAIQVSQSDYTALTQDNNANIAALKIDPSLNSGDVIVKSKFGEVNAIINDRIDELFRINNE